jgi:hypothetical protein
MAHLPHPLKVKYETHIKTNYSMVMFMNKEKDTMSIKMLGLKEF